MSSNYRHSSLDRERIMKSLAGEFFKKGTKGSWDTLKLISSGEFIAPGVWADQERQDSLDPEKVRANRNLWRSVGWPFDSFSEPFGPKDAHRIITYWTHLSGACSDPQGWVRRGGISFRPTEEDRRKEIPGYRAWKHERAKKNPAPVVVAAIIQAFLPLIMSLGTRQINAYKKASTEDQIKMLKKWSMFLSPPVRLALQHKKSARNIATKLSALLNDPETMANLKEAGKAGIEVGQAYRGAKGKAPRRIAAKRNTREVNPYSRRYTLASFTKKYFPGERVSPGVAKSFWDDFRFGYQGGLSRYIKETTWVDGEQLAKKNPVGSGQKFVIVDVSIPGGRWVDEIIYDNARKADRKAAKLLKEGHDVQVIDAVWFGPAERRLRTVGLRNNPKHKAYVPNENHRRTLEWYKAHPYWLLAVKLDSAAKSYKEEGREWAYRELVRRKKVGGAYDAALNEMTDREELVRLSNRISHHVRKIDALFRSGNPYAAKKNPKKGGKWYSNFSEGELRYKIEDLEEKLADSYRLDWSHELDDWLADTRVDLAGLRRELKWQEAKKGLREGKLVGTSIPLRDYADVYPRDLLKRLKAKKNGPTLGKPHYPFAEKEKQYAKYTPESLDYAKDDAMAASRAQQDWNEAGANWYMDDYHTIVKEIQRRKGRR